MSLVFVAFLAVVLTQADDSETLTQPRLNGDDRPNIVFILFDDMGNSDVSAKGSPIQTPNMDKLIENGLQL